MSHSAQFPVFVFDLDNVLYEIGTPEELAWLELGAQRHSDSGSQVGEMRGAFDSTCRKVTFAYDRGTKQFRALCDSAQSGGEEQEAFRSCLRDSWMMLTGHDSLRIRLIPAELVASATLIAIAWE